MHPDKRQNEKNPKPVALYKLNHPGFLFYGPNQPSLLHEYSSFTKLSVSRTICLKKGHFPREPTAFPSASSKASCSSGFREPIMLIIISISASRSS